MGLIIRKHEKVPTAEREKEQNPDVLERKSPEKKVRKEAKEDAVADKKLAAFYAQTERAITADADVVVASLTTLSVARGDGGGTLDGAGTKSPADAIRFLEGSLPEFEDGDLSVAERSRMLSKISGPLSEVIGWRRAHLSAIVELESELASAKRESLEIAAMRNREEGRGFFGKLFNGAVREQLSRAFIRQTERKDVLARRLEIEQAAVFDFGYRIDIIDEHVARMERGVAVELVKKIDAGYKEVVSEACSVERVAKMNEGLLADAKKKFLVEHPAFKIDETLAPLLDEYAALLLEELHPESGSRHSSPEEQKKRAARRLRMDILNADSHYNLSQMASVLGATGMDNPSESYKEVAGLMVGEMARKKGEAVLSRLAGMLGEDDIALVKKQLPKGAGEYPIDELSQNDAVRFGSVCRSLEDSKIGSKEFRGEVEHTIVDRLYREVLLPGGRESWGGTSAASIMQTLNNPEALPLLLEHIRLTGVGHTNNSCVYAMESLLANSPREKLAQVVEALPKAKQEVLSLLADDNSFLNKYGRLNARYASAKFLQTPELTIAREKMARILRADPEFYDEAALQSFYAGIGREGEVVTRALVRRKEETQSAIIESKSNCWAVASDKLLSQMVNPRNGESSEFPRRILRDGLGVVDDDMDTRLKDVYESKAVKNSGFDREAILDGFILLNSKENGGESARMLLSAYRPGNKKDPERLRRVLQIAGTLEELESYVILRPSKEDVGMAEKQIEELSVLFEAAVKAGDKAGKKQLKDKLVTAENRLADLTGLKGIEEEMTKRVTDVFCRRINNALGLGQYDPRALEFRDTISGKMDELMKTGVLTIVTSLLGRYEQVKAPEVSKTLAMTVEHIAAGDFKDWKYGNDKSALQLRTLTEDGRKKWQENGSEVVLRADSPRDESTRRTEQASTVRWVLQNAKEHISDYRPEFEFSEQAIFDCRKNIDEEKRLIAEASCDEEIRMHNERMRRLMMEQSVIADILEIEQMPAERVSLGEIEPIAGRLRSNLALLGMSLAAVDVAQVDRVFAVGSMSVVSARETDDPVDLLNVGTEPQETCQSWRSGGYNECLLAYVADANKKLINVAGDNGEVLARSVIKMVPIREVNNTAGNENRSEGRPNILAEAFYSIYSNPDVYRVFGRKLFAKGDEVGASVSFGQKFPEVVMGIMDEEAAKFGYRRVPDDVRFEVYIPPSVNSYEYSDSLGGKVSTFNIHRQFNGVVYEKI